MGGEFSRYCIHHHTYRHLRLFYDYALLYKNFTRAGIVRILEAATNVAMEHWEMETAPHVKSGKPRPVEPPHWITLSHAQIRSYLIVGPMGEQISEPTVRKHLADLEKMKHISRRVNPSIVPKERYGAPQYLLNFKLIQKELDKQKSELEEFLEHLLENVGDDFSDSEESDEIQTPLPGVNNGRGVKPLEGGKDLQGVQSVKGGKSFAGGTRALPPAKNVSPPLTSIEPGGLHQLKGGGANVYTPITSNYNDITNNIDSSSPESQQNTDDSDDETQEGEEEITPLSEKNDQDSDDIDPTEKHSIVSRNPASSTIGDVTQASKRQSVIPARPKAPTSGQPTVEEAKHLFDARCQKLLERIAVWRGYVLDSSQGAIYTELQNVKRLIAAYPDDADIEFGHLYLSCWHPQYRGTQPDFRYAQLLLDEIPNALNWRAKTLSSATSAADPPVAQAKPKPVQQQADNPYSLENLFALNNGRGLTGG